MTAPTTHFNAAAVIKLNGVVDADGTVNLAVGDNTITVEVTAEDPATMRTYTVTVARARAPAPPPPPPPPPPPRSSTSAGGGSVGLWSPCSSKAQRPLARRWRMQNPVPL